MPHQFKLAASHPAVSYLVRLHFDIGGRILEKKEGLRLVESMKHATRKLRPITNKLKRWRFPATFFLAVLAASELDGIAL
jgi:hypothetical protein